MTAELVLRVANLIGHPERRRFFAGSTQVELRLGETTVSGPVEVTGEVVGTIDGVQAEYKTAGTVRLVCVRCLTEWAIVHEVEGSQHFSPVPDEDGYVLVDGQIDLTGPAIGDLALDLPAAPLCREDCKGLCPICGTDLNEDPCDGHGADSDSPFAALKDLFDP